MVRHSRQQCWQIANSKAYVNPANFIDERFAGLFEDEDFAIDETSDTFKLANPSGITRQAELRRKVVSMVLVEGMMAIT